MDILALIRIGVALGCVGEQFVPVTDPGFTNPEYLAANSLNVLGDGTAAGAMITRLFTKDPRTRTLEARLKNSALDEYSQKSARRDLYTSNRMTSFIYLAITFVDVLESLTGFEPPVEGDAFVTGADQFEATASLLASAFPDDRWQGAATQLHAQQNAQQQSCAEAMAPLDPQLAAIVKNQAESVTHIRVGLGAVKNLLAVAYVIEVALMTRGDMLGRRIAAWVAGIGVSAATVMILGLLGRSSSNSAAANELAYGYSLASSRDDNVLASVAVPLAGGAGAAVSAVSAFDALSGSNAGGSATARTATAADQHAFFAAALGEGENPGNAAPAAKTMAAPVSTLTMPTLAPTPRRATPRRPQPAPDQSIQPAATPIEDVAPTGDTDSAAASTGAAAGARVPTKAATAAPQLARDLNA